MGKDSDDKPRLSLVGLKASMDEQAGQTAKALEAVASLETAVAGFQKVLASLDERFGRLEVSAPPILRALDAQTVAQVIKSDPYAEFEVLTPWKRAGLHLPQGRVIRADRYPRLLDAMRAGLRLGMAQDQDAIIEKHKQHAQARAEAYRDEAIAKAKAVAEAAQSTIDDLS